MAREVFFQGLARWFERREMRSRLRRLGIAEPAVELEWARAGDGFRVHGMGKVEVARVDLEGDGRILRVAMTEDCPYGWRVTYHGNLRSARREVEGQAGTPPAWRWPRRPKGSGTGTGAGRAEPSS